MQPVLAADAVHRLFKYNLTRLLPGTTTKPEMDMEEEWYIDSLRLQARLTDGMKIDQLSPKEAKNRYYELLEHGPGQGDTLFPWLAKTATRDQMIWFLQQEAAGEAGFDDLVAMTQVKMPTEAKLEMARNYWDEMGRGKAAGMHNRLLHQIAQYFGIVPAPEAIVEESKRLANVMTALAFNRRYAWMSVGCLGVVEMTAPGRVVLVDQGLARLEVPAEARHYFALHATLDIAHSKAWNQKIVETVPEEYLPSIYEGAYLRLWCGKGCFDRYRKELGV